MLWNVSLTCFPLIKPIQALSWCPRTEPFSLKTIVAHLLWDLCLKPASFCSSYEYLACKELALKCKVWSCYTCRELVLWCKVWSCCTLYDSSGWKRACINTSTAFPALCSFSPSLKNLFQVPDNSKQQAETPAMVHLGIMPLLEPFHLFSLLHLLFFLCFTLYNFIWLFLSFSTGGVEESCSAGQVPDLLGWCDQKLSLDFWSWRCIYSMCKYVNNSLLRIL